VLPWHGCALQDRKKLTAVTPPQSLLLLPIRSQNFVGISIILLSNRILTQKSDRCLLWGILMARESGFPAGPPEICFSGTALITNKKEKKLHNSMLRLRPRTNYH